MPTGSVAWASSRATAAMNDSYDGQSSRHKQPELLLHLLGLALARRKTHIPSRSNCSCREEECFVVAVVTRQELIEREECS